MTTVWILLGVAAITAFIVWLVRRKSKSSAAPKNPVSLSYFENGIIVDHSDQYLVLRYDGGYDRLAKPKDGAGTSSVVAWADRKGSILGKEVYRSVIDGSNVRKLDDALLVQGVSLPGSHLAHVLIAYPDGTWTRRTVNTRRSPLVRA